MATIALDDTLVDKEQKATITPAAAGTVVDARSQADTVLLPVHSYIYIHMYVTNQLEIRRSVSVPVPEQTKGIVIIIIIVFNIYLFVHYFDVLFVEVVTVFSLSPTQAYHHQQRYLYRQRYQYPQRYLYQQRYRLPSC